MRKCLLAINTLAVGLGFLAATGLEAQSSEATLFAEGDPSKMLAHAVQNNITAVVAGGGLQTGAIIEQLAPVLRSKEESANYFLFKKCLKAFSIEKTLSGPPAPRRIYVIGACPGASSVMKEGVLPSEEPRITMHPSFGGEGERWILFLLPVTDKVLNARGELEAARYFADIEKSRIFTAANVFEIYGRKLAFKIDDEPLENGRTKPHVVPSASVDDIQRLYQGKRTKMQTELGRHAAAALD